MTFIVLPLVLLAAGYSATVAATIGTASLVVALVTRLPAYYLSDRYDQRTLMLLCDLLRMCAVGRWRSTSSCALCRSRWPWRP